MPNRKRRFVVSAALAGTLLASACQLQPGAAAFVGDTRISDNQVDTIVDAAVDSSQANLQTSDLISLRQQVTSVLVQQALYERAARDAGIAVTDDEVDHAIQQQANQSGGSLEDYLTQQAQRGLTPDLLRVQVRLGLINQELGDKLAEQQDVPTAKLREAYRQYNVLQQTGLSFGQVKDQLERLVLVQEDITTLAKNVDIKINPRYGRFDRSQLAVVPAQNDLVVPDRGGASSAS